MVAPWLGFTGYGSQLKEAILNISNDERNLLIPPPAGANFEFDLNAYDSTAQAALKEDEKLAKLRFLLVPQQVSESVFWQNYFYRVKITKQMVFGNPPESPLIGGDKDMNDKKNVLFDYEDDTDDKNTKKIIEKKNDRKRDCSIQNKAENDTNPNALEVKRGNHTDKEYEGMEDWEIEMRREAIQ
ncbi:hypothetical protein BDF20DRAFT_886242 [Mycotypha africana]|uniref:uncharacterized protein n=1 Tax=Mycotypha africana TaxID=64632 RepID=UPI002301EB89|nr:uncharacterized protein BDF20DRAFT_886242 [Mycotypha africana]KAI8971740.1 hypothetical protein BDF20DRAFT_886242 [Mycotypha africana]